MLKKSEIKKLSIMLNWRIEDIEYAIKELIDSPSIIDCEGFLKICIKSKNVHERFEKVEKFLLNTLNDDLVKTVCNLLYGDPCFQALSLINAYDLSSTKNLNLNVTTSDKHLNSKYKKSFFNLGMFYPIENGQPLINDKNYRYLDFRTQSYSFIETLIVNRFSKPIGNDRRVINLKEMEDLTIEVVAKTGFLAFNISIFLRNVTVLTYLDRNHETLKKLGKTFNSFMSRSEIINYQHWMIYALVEKLRQEGYSVRKSFKKAGQLLNLSKPSSIKPRYYERKKEAKKLNLSLNDIIRDKGLSRALIEILGKLH